MTKHDLKELSAIGAELAAVKADLQREMERHRKTWRQLEQVRGLLRDLREITSEYAWDAELEARVDAALSQQAEPAPAQDERKTFEVEIPDISAIYDGRSFIPYRSLEAGERLMTVAQHLRIEKQLRAALTRPAQTEQQPVHVTAVAVTRQNEDGELYLDWLLEGGICELEFAGQVLVWADQPITDDEGHGEVYAAPIEQTALSSVTAERDRLLAFVTECAGTAGGMVNGNKLSNRAKELIAALAAKEA